jgi:hypothetical protein
LVVGAVCCVVFAGRSVAHEPRAAGTKKGHPGAPAWKLEGLDKVNENVLDGPLRPGNAQPTGRAAAGFSFKGMAARYDPVLVQ